MGFPCRHEDGTLLDIVAKSHDDGTGVEIFTDSAGKEYTRALASGGNDAHTLIDYVAPGPYVEQNDGDLVVDADDDTTVPTGTVTDSSAAEAAAPAAEPTVEDAAPLADEAGAAEGGTPVEDTPAAA